ncbi:prenylcysteine oxidase 1-like [Babylonia areolata]|uniref:prenylcysteine oxidase 1-like n=1 Tax=Babylonia areolata TaxID=304850 RepID=UPI003FD2908F
MPVLAVCLLFSLVHHLVSGQADEEIPRIGIVGAGIGGTSAAYFLRQAFGDKLQVDIFEGERVGGRLAVINIDGQEYEAGGSIIHPRNQYMVNFTQSFGLSPKDQGEGGTLGLYNSQEGLYLQTSKWTPVTLAKMFWRYGWDMKRIQDWVADMFSSFNKIYEYQEKGMAFTTVEDLLRAMDEKFVNYTHHSTRTVMKDAGFSDIFIDELVTGAFRDNYGQTPDIQAFVGAVCMAGAEPGLWAVKGGNKQVAEKLLKASGAKLVRGAVTHVFQVKSEGGTVSYEVQYDKGEGTREGEEEDRTGSREYDLLIIATPLTSGSKLKIQFEDFPSKLHIPNIPYHTLEALFVHGRPNVSHFGVESLEDFPTELMTTDTETFFNKLGKLTPVVSKEHLAGKPDDVEGYGVWKAFLNKVPSEMQLKLLFDSRKDLRLVSWPAYPAYTSDMELPSFVLHDRLYFINAIESAAAAMEMSVIGAKNVALLAFNQWFSHFDRINELVFPSAETTEDRKVDEL